MILAAHNGVQGGLVCAIQDSSSTNILEKQSAIEMLNWLDTLEGDRPKERLADFGMLAKKFRKKYRAVLTPEQHSGRTKARTGAGLRTGLGNGCRVTREARWIPLSCPRRNTLRSGASYL
jgi:hypothetical protein